MDPSGEGDSGLYMSETLPKLPTHTHLTQARPRLQSTPLTRIRTQRGPNADSDTSFVRLSNLTSTDGSLYVNDNTSLKHCFEQWGTGGSCGVVGGPKNCVYATNSYSCSAIGQEGVVIHEHTWACIGE